MIRTIFYTAIALLMANAAQAEITGVSCSDATYCSIISSGAYTLVTVSTSTTVSFTGTGTVDVVQVGGGGGGAGNRNGYPGGGGGAGGYKYTPGYSVSGDYSVVIGTAGAAGIGGVDNATANGVGGGLTTFSTMTVQGGGGGGGRTGSYKGLNGGSGGGAPAYNGTTMYGLGIAGQGYRGSDGGASYSGGGGGAAEYGAQYYPGKGVVNPITSTCVAIGGGGFTPTGTCAGSNTINKTFGTGSGGYGTLSSNANGNAGSSGVVILRMPLIQAGSSGNSNFFQFF